MMSLITGVLYAALVAYLGGWYVGQWQGNFSLLLFVLTLIVVGLLIGTMYRRCGKPSFAPRQPDQMK